MPEVSEMTLSRAEVSEKQDKLAKDIVRLMTNFHIETGYYPKVEITHNIETFIELGNPREYRLMDSASCGVDLI